MSRELVKWLGGKLVPSPIAENRRVLTEALTLVRPAPLARGNAAGLPAFASGEPGQIVDVPRRCAVHEDRIYAARYVRGADGRFHHAQTIKVTEALFLAQYADTTRGAVVPGRDMADEICPWCGASGFGSVYCGICRFEICYGRTTGRYFRCRPSCPNKGNMTMDNRSHEGVTPKETRGGGYRV